jgi:hypothetical protein
MKGEIGKIEDGGRVCKKRGEAGWISGKLHFP